MPKKNRPTTTVNVDAVKRDVAKMGKKIASDDSAPMGRELAPGSVRRESPLEQAMGPSKYRKMIHDHNDKNKHILDRLPFTFPRKKIVRSNLSDVPIECSECGHQSYGSEHTYMKVCAGCKKTTKVINPEAEARGEDRDFSPGFLASVSDILRMREEREKKKKDSKLA